MSKRTKPADWLVCNCAGCYRELVSASMRDELKASGHTGIRFVAGRIHDRPYCDDCIRVNKPKPGAMTLASYRDDDDNPWRANAVRDLEDNR